MVEFRNVVTTLGGKRILDGLSFVVPSGQITFLLGRSGAGKSVALRHIPGLLHADSGEVLFAGRPVPQDEQALAEVRRQCGVVFQFPALLDALTVEGNLRLARPEVAPAALLERVGLSRDLLTRYPHALSFGVQKRVSMARALTSDPRLLLFDEPTTGLDPVAAKATHTLIAELSRSLGATALVVSHDIAAALEFADQILLLERGQLVDQGSPSAIRRSCAPFTRQFLEAAG